MTLLRSRFWQSAIAAFFVMSIVPLAMAQSFAVPPNDGFYTETLDILSPEQEERIETALGAYAHETGDSIAVLLTQSMSGVTLAGAAQETAERWKLETGSGRDILIMAALADHEEVIVVGGALSDTLSEEVMGGVIETDIQPHFNRGEYEEGLMAAVDALQKHISGRYTAVRYEARSGAGFFRGLLVILLLAIQYLAARLFWRRRWWVGAVLGGAFGLWLAFRYSWWLAVPSLIVAGACFDCFMIVMSRDRRRHTRFSTTRP